MTDPIQPALTPKEWEEHRRGRLALRSVSFGQRSPDAGGDAADLQRIAALVLYGQPFGFTWEDVDLCVSWNESPTMRAALANLGTRIAALLPPREAP